MKDLSNHHHLIGSMFPQLEARDIWDKYRLSDEQVNHFNEFGYLSNIMMLEEDQVDQLNKNNDLEHF